MHPQIDRLPHHDSDDLLAGMEEDEVAIDND